MSAAASTSALTLASVAAVAPPHTRCYLPETNLRKWRVAFDRKKLESGGARSCALSLHELNVGKALMSGHSCPPASALTVHARLART